jgi:hypothetical protein
MKFEIRSAIREITVTYMCGYLCGSYFPLGFQKEAGVTRGYRSSLGLPCDVGTLDSLYRMARVRPSGARIYCWLRVPTLREPWHECSIMALSGVEGIHDIRLLPADYPCEISDVPYEHPDKNLILISHTKSTGPVQPILNTSLLLSVSRKKLSGW